MSLSRRTLLASLGTAGLLHAAGLTPSIPTAAADGVEDAPILVFIYFAGGWDTLLGLDPRDNTKFSQPGFGIQTDYGDLTDPESVNIIGANPSGLILPSDPSSPLAFGPAIGRLVDHYEDLCVVRGMDMGTLTHEVGMRHFITGQFPRGVRARGSGLPTWHAAQELAPSPIPNLALGGMEAYNDGLSANATGVTVRGQSELTSLLRPAHRASTTSEEIEAALSEHGPTGCLRRQLDAKGMVTSYEAALRQGADIGSGDLWQHFDFSATPSAAIQEVYAAFGIQPQLLQYQLNAPEGRAATAAQAITNDLCQAISIRIEDGLDTHFNNWATSHAARLRRAFNAVADLISFLKQRTDKNGKTYWSRTVLACFSEFARTPLRNSSGGRDHHLTNSALVAGLNIRGNQVIGASGDEDYRVVPFDFDAQAPAATGTAIRPADVHRTLCEAMGIGFEHLADVDPRLLTNMLTPT